MHIILCDVGPQMATHGSAELATAFKDLHANTLDDLQMSSVSLPMSFYPLVKPYGKYDGYKPLWDS